MDGPVIYVIVMEQKGELKLWPIIGNVHTSLYKQVTQMGGPGIYVIVTGQKGGQKQWLMNKCHVWVTIQASVHVSAISILQAQSY